MAKPVYILCAQSGSEDKNTGLFSVFGIIERIAFKTKREAKEGAQPAALLKIFTLAVCMREEGDADGEMFDGEFLMRFPPDGKELTIGDVPFSFPAGRMLFRNVMEFDGPLPFFGDGTLEVIHRFRKHGTEAWTAQSYPIRVEAATEEPLTAQDEPGQLDRRAS